MTFIAHKDKEGQVQLLKEHLENVANICFSIGEKVYLSNTSYLLGLCHDMGKYSLEFQSYIKDESKSLVNHSSAGGIYVSEKIKSFVKSGFDKKDIKDYFIISEILSYVIFAHHGFFDLIDFNKNGKDEIDSFKRRAKQKNNDYKELILRFEDEIMPFVRKKGHRNIDELVLSSINEMRVLFSKISNMIINKNKKNVEFYYYTHCTVRLLLSILKEGDIYDSSNAFLGEKLPRYSNGQVQDFLKEGLERVEEKYCEFESKSQKKEIDIIRSGLSNLAKNRAIQIDSGILLANLPTGSGKTLLTTRFALNNAISNYKKDRIFYVTAFLSVLEQNAFVIKDFFKDEKLILEHHSNVIMDMEESEEESKMALNMYLQESWEAPLILTTMVQYANTQFKGRAANIRRFCKFINSVIIIDEIQSVPIKMTYIHNLMSNYLSNIMGAVIVHATATQPNLASDELKYKILFNDKFKNLVSLNEAEKEVFKRTKQVYIQNEEDEQGIFDKISLKKQILKKLESRSSILIILNTKRAVDELYTVLKDERQEDVILFQLSTNKTANHRLKDIKDIKLLLENIQNNNCNEKIVCVSTALIEAGVDVDFQVVYRSMAPISSLIQSMGRCNREGSLESGDFYVFEYRDEDISRIRDIMIGVSRTKNIIYDKKGKEIFLEELVKQYYDELYLNYESELYFKSNNDDSSVFELLSDNIKNRKEFKRVYSTFNHGLGQNFKKASEIFEFIEDCGTSVIVKYGEKFREVDKDSYNNNNELIKELDLAYKAYDYKEIKKIAKKLQVYTISVRNIDKYRAYISVIGDYYILDEAYYNLDIGLNCKELEILL